MRFSFDRRPNANVKVIIMFVPGHDARNARVVEQNLMHRRMRAKDRDKPGRACAVVYAVLEPGHRSLRAIEPECPDVELQAVHVAVMFALLPAIGKADISDAEPASIGGQPLALHEEKDGKQRRVPVLPSAICRRAVNVIAGAFRVLRYHKEAA